MHLTSHITHSNGYAPYIAYYRSNGFDQRFRKLKPKPKLSPPNAHRSQIKICDKRQTQNVQFRFMPNAFRILKSIQKSSKRVWVFRNTGANAFAKNQMRLAYEDKRDLYCIMGLKSTNEPNWLGQFSENVNGGGISWLRLANNFCRCKNTLIIDLGGAQLYFQQLILIFNKSKMAATETRKVNVCHIISTKCGRNINKTSLCML